MKVKLKMIHKLMNPIITYIFFDFCLTFCNKCQHRVVTNLCKHNSNSHLSIAGFLYNMDCVKCFICSILFNLYMCSFHPLCLEGVYI